MRTQLDLSDIVQSPEFSQQILITRKSLGQWYKGVYTDNPTYINTFGVISATDEKEIKMVPEGDRVDEMKAIHVTIPIFSTRSGVNARNADLISYNGEMYKVIKIINAGDYGYWKAIIGKVGTTE